MLKGRRVAYVVFNDVYRDSRVLKTADSASAAGMQVRVYAIGGVLSHFPAGVEHRPSGAEIHRLSVLPERIGGFRYLLPVARRMAGSGATVLSRSAAPAAQGPAAGNQLSVGRALGRARARVSAVAIGALLRMRERDFRRRAVREITAWGPALVHAHDANTLEIAVDVRRRTGAPFIYDAHELWEERNRLRSDTAAQRERQLLDRATMQMSGSVTVSPSIAEWMVERYELTESPVLVRNIPMAPAGIVDSSRGRLRELTDLAPSTKVVTYVGGITSGRGIDEAISVLGLLPDNVHLVLLGQGTAKAVAEFTALAERQGVGHRVHLAGSVPSDEVSSAAADADVSLVFTQPKNLSYKFSLPNKLFESIHAGLPVVASALPDVTELVERYAVGKVVGHDDLEAMAAAIMSVVDDPASYREAARRATLDLSWEHEMERLHELYDRVLASPGRVVRS